ncbi:MAG TPA: CocE/NonD family hydrolase [Solirubrobacteraceae bacterium]|nr:CocE/NonD family hydrolase [Solirubrobacteraceae bacterium]
MAKMVSGIEPGQRQLNGTQTTGREYQRLSTPEYEMTHDFDVEAPMRDGINLLTDVYRPDAEGRFPVLIAASPYPRQIQNSGAPMGFIEAGASDFWVPRGYVHVIANLRGTGGSSGTFGFMDGQERQDLHDLVEWAAAQPWSDGNVGMLGISYFASTQVQAATQQPEHLKAIFALEATTDLYQSAVHHGLMSASFVTTFLAMIGMTSGHTNKLWRSRLVNGVSDLLRTPHIHGKFATSQGDAAMAGLRVLLKLRHDPHPWDDIWREVAVEHPVRDEWWEDHSMVPLFDNIQVPAYLGCDWENVPLHLPGSLAIIKALLDSNPNVRVALVGDLGISWPWETMHIEALAWFDHWLKGRDTGILEGPRVRYQLRKGETDGWKTADRWPIPGIQHQELALRNDGKLGADEGDPGQRTYMVLGAGLNRARPSEADPPSSLAWETDILTSDPDLLGEIELRLDATASAADTAWIVTLRDVAPDDSGADITAGYLRASLRAVDEHSSTQGNPVLPCTTPIAVPINQLVSYRIPIVGTGYRVAAGHRLRLALTSDDQDPDYPAMMTFRHATVGTSSLNRIASSSRLVLPIAAGKPYGPADPPRYGC